MDAVLLCPTQDGFIDVLHVLVAGDTRAAGCEHFDANPCADDVIFDAAQPDEVEAFG